LLCLKRQRDEGRTRANGSTYTPLDAPGASDTYAYGIDGSGYHGFRATLGAPVPLPAASWMALPLLGVMTVIGKMRRRRCA